MARRGVLSRRDLLRSVAGATGGLGAAALLAACQAPAVSASASPTAAAPVIKRGGQVTFALSAVLNTMDPNRVDSLQMASVIKHVFRSLTNFDKDANPVPDLAEKWQTSADGMAWTFQLRSGVKFHDGTPFNAEAVKVNLDRILDPANKLPRRSQIAMVKSVDVLSDTSVRLNLQYPFSDLLNNLAYYSTQLGSPAALKRWGNNDVALHPVGVGPYKVDVFSPNERIVLLRNPDWYGEGAYLDRITIISVSDDGARQAALESGQADLILNVPPQALPTIKSNTKLKTIQTPSSRTLYIGMNMFRDEFQDKRVRQALNYAVDKESIVKNVLGGLGHVSESPFASNLYAFAKQTPYTYDPAKAKQLLAEAGWTLGANGVLQKGGKPLSVPFLTSQGRYIQDAQTAEAVQGYLRAVGVDAQLRKLDQQTIFDLMRKPSARTPQAETALTLFAIGSGPGTATYADTFNSYDGKFDNTNSVTSFYRSPNVDKLLLQAAAQTDEAKRLAVYKEIQSTIWDDVPWIFLHYLDQTGAQVANLNGVVVTPNEFWFLDKAWLA